jgi:predicted membrane chloride channel (bestrophin family)
VTKIATFGVALIGVAILLGFRDKESLQRLVER